MNEEGAIQDFLVDYLSSDQTLMDLANGVWLRSVPVDVATPTIKIDRQEGSDLMVVNLYRVWTDFLFLIRGTVENTERGAADWSTVRAIADRIDVLLHKFETVTSELQVHSFREESFSDESIEGGKLYLHLGGFYRVRGHAI